ncbi:MAG TPA: molybdopterin-dependent oxidoreductase [Clostridiales bacterium]|nr:molybdopterin-dependent oxidoreductase [Clostridiales bacterium]HQP69166.1 molybdopterin-dependent oxidoreductase [Clostridiales bacterium]
MRRTGFYFTIAAAVLLFIIQGCAKTDVPKQNEADKFIISGAGGDVSVTIAELIKDYKPVTMTVTSVNSSGEKNQLKVTGALFKDVLKSKGIDPASFSTVRTISGDSYSIEIPEEIISAREIVLVYKIDGEFLNEKSRPLKIVIPDERAMYWARNVVKIELIQRKHTVMTDKIVFLESAYKNLKQTKYLYYENNDLAVSVKDLLSAYSPASDSGLCFITTDSLKRTETKENAMISFIKFTGKGKPLFLSPDLPGGMYIKNVVLFKQQNVCYYSLESAMLQNPSLTLPDIFKTSEFAESVEYRLTTLTGDTITASGDELRSCKISFESSAYSCLFDGKEKPLKDILTVEKIY